MARRPSPTISTDGQVSLFDLPARPVSLDGFGLVVRDALAETLARAKAAKGMDRFDIAAAMGRLSGEREYAKHTIDRWCAPSAEDWRMPLEALPALVRVTGDAALLRLVAEAACHQAIPNEAAALAELALVEVEMKRLGDIQRDLRNRISPAKVRGMRK